MGCWLLFLAACQNQPPVQSVPVTAARSGQAQPTLEKPKLVVGVIVDQMRTEYLYRYAEGFTEGGFKRLMREGFANHNTHFNYIPTFTGPGHATVFSGATPAAHGIVGNDWYSRELRRPIYCVADTSVQVVGSSTGLAASPHLLLVTNLADELKLATNNRAQVVGVSLKERSAVLPAGHIPDGAYWYDGASGKFISSTYYMQQLPDWLTAFNELGLPGQYLDSTWTQLLPEAFYQNSGPDDVAYERLFKGKSSPTFPYPLAELRQANGNFRLLNFVPWGNTIVTDLALAALQGESMGQGQTTDMLTISYSTPDIIGHDFGLRSRELHDMYLRLDREIARLLEALDAALGRDNYLFFLTADHAAADVPDFMQLQRIPAGYYPDKSLAKALDAELQQRFAQAGLVESLMNEQVYLNHRLMREAGLNRAEVQQATIDFLNQQPYVVDAYPADIFRLQGFSHGQQLLLQMGYYRPRSGDVLFLVHPAWMKELDPAITTHGSGYTYDTHVPLLWYGWHIPRGVSYKRRAITDIAPTISHLLGIGLPSGATGEPIEEILLQKVVQD
jgi:predicted AlkP superfamily pyrophosphatase or phosphodiesterase